MGCADEPLSQSFIANRSPLKTRSVLLASASYGGTLAAVRNLAAHGFDVGLVSSLRRFSAAVWSRHASRSYVGPPESDHRRFVERLLQIGAKHPGQVLLATSDETAWIYTERRDDLAQVYRVNQPSLGCMRRILDKQLFAEAAASVGLATLPEWYPGSLEEVEALAQRVEYPILVKRRTHVHRSTNDKGLVVHSKSQLIEEYRKFLAREATRVTTGSPLAFSGLPFLQQFVDTTDEGVCSVTGFIDRTGESFVTRRSTKIFQRSVPVGVGVCFESRNPDVDLAQTVRRLCRELDYFGIFEIEFVRFKGAWAAIDFNPRLFNQVALDIARGMPLPAFAVLEALGEIDTMRAMVADAQIEDGRNSTVFADTFTLRAILLARRLTGRTSPSELAYWQGWIREHAGNLVDVVRNEDDPIPELVHALSEIHLGLKAIPKFLRLTPRGRVGPKKQRLGVDA